MSSTLAEVIMKNWTDLSSAQKTSIERAYKEGKEPGEIAKRYGLKPKQISDQAYRKNWSHRGRSTKGGAGRKKRR